MENKDIISNEDALEISKALEEQNADNPNIALARDIEDGEYNADENTSDIEEGVEGLFDDGTVGMDLYEASKDIVEGEASEETIKELSEKFNLPFNEISELIKIADRWKKKEKFSLYAAMPETIKGIINNQIFEAGGTPTNESRSLYCNLFMEEFTSEIIDKYLDKEIIDFNKSIQDTLGSITNITDMYAGHIRYMMEVELVKLAEKAETEEAKKIYLGCSDAFKESYRYTRMLDTLANNGKARRKLYKDNFQYTRFCNDFDYKNKDTKYSIRNIYQMGTGLYDNLSKELGLTNEDCMAFVILFIKSAINMDMSEIINSTYVYYSIFNIVNLGFDTNKSKFYHVIVNNIKKVFNAMWEHTGDTRRFDIEDDIDWVEEVSKEDIEEFEKELEKDLDSKIEENE